MKREIKTLSAPENFKPATEIKERHLRLAVSIWEGAGGDALDGTEFTAEAIYRYAEAFALQDMFTDKILGIITLTPAPASPRPSQPPAQDRP